MIVFVTLIGQIDTGIKSAYKGTEVIEAVIRVVNSSLKLRSYLVMISSGLTLRRLKQILRAHAQLCQGPKKSAQDFLIRSMNLRQ